MAIHQAHILTDAGDVTICWNPSNTKDVEDAKATFKHFMQQGYEAYVVVKGEPSLANRLFKTEPEELHSVDKFDETIGKLLMRKKVVLAPTTVQGGYPTSGMNEGRL